MKICAISDTHEMLARMEPLPDADVLVHAGDLTGIGDLYALKVAVDFLAAQRHRYKVVTAGNHDWCFERYPVESRLMLKDAGLLYLQDRSTTIEGLKFYGSPWQPEFYNWAFNLPRGHELRNKWQLIDDDTAVLVTHSPPQGILDLAPGNRHEGCADLMERVQHLTRLRAHIFGHIHEGYGREVREIVPGQTVQFVNASTCTGNYKPTNKPMVIEI